VFAYLRSNKRGAAIIAVALAAVTINSAVSWISDKKPAHTQQATEQHPDMVYADGTHYRWDGTQYQNTTDSAPKPTINEVRHYHSAVTDDGTQYRLYDECKFSHEIAQSRYIRTPMSLLYLQRTLECDGEVLSETASHGFHQKVIVFRGNDTHDTIIATVDRQRVIGIDRQF